MQSSSFLPINSDSDLESVVSLQDDRLSSSKPKSRRNSLEPKYVCRVEDDCGASFKRLDHLDRHEYHHTGVKKHICHFDGCDKTYSILTHLKRHIRSTHERPTEISQKIIPCSLEECKKMFTNVSNMHRHVREFHEHPKVYPCSQCSQKFSQKIKMRRHEIQKHTNNYPYSCDKCKRGFFQRWQQESHVAKCKVYPCANCDLLFDKWSLYVKHCRETLHGRQYYKCEYCDRTYSKPSELQKHVAANHIANNAGDEQTAGGYDCKEPGCERSYAYERNLRQHILTAHGGKRFKCEVAECSRSFSSAQNLAKHVAQVHDANKAPTSIQKDRKKKVNRKKRKDAGLPAVAHLVQLSGLEVDRATNKTLRTRDAETLASVSSTLAEQAQNETEDLNDIDP